MWRRGTTTPVPFIRLIVRILRILSSALSNSDRIDRMHRRRGAGSRPAQLFILCILVILSRFTKKQKT